MELLAQVPAGGYTVRNLTANTSATVTVPTLTASITPGTYVEGVTLTLTTNASARSTYQWRRNGTNILGATNSTLVTVAGQAGSIDCVVASGLQSVTTAAITLTAGVTRALNRQPIGGLLLPSDNSTGTQTTDLGFSAPAGSRLIMAAAISRRSGTGSDLTGITVGGQAATRVTIQTAPVPVAFFEIASLSSAVTSTTPVGWTWPASMNVRDFGWQFWRPEGYGAIFAFTPAVTPGNAASLTFGLNVPATGALLVARGISTTAFGQPTFAGATFRAEFEDPAGGLSFAVADAVELAAETNRQITITETAATVTIRAAAISLSAA